MLHGNDFEQNVATQLFHDKADSGRWSGQTEASSTDCERESCQIQNLECRLHQLLEPKVQQTQLSPKLLTKAVSWLQLNSWNQGLDSESSVLAITYFHIYIANREIKKFQLESILAACLFLASKLVRRPELKIDQILQVVNESISPKDIIRQESVLLDIMGWDAWVMEGFYEGMLVQDDECLERVNFLLEGLFLLGKNPVSDPEMLKEISTEAGKTSMSRNFLGLASTLKKKQGKVVISKYNSKFDAGLWAQGAIL